MKNFSSLQAFALPPADDPYFLAASRAGAFAACLSFHFRPQAPRSFPGRPARPARPTASGHRPGPRHHVSQRPTLAQRLPGARPRWPAPQEGQGRHAQVDRRSCPRPPAMGDRRPARAGARPGQLDVRRTGRPPVQDQGRPRAEIGHAGVLPQARHSPLPPHLPLPARRSRQTSGCVRGPGGLNQKSDGGRTGATEPGRGAFPDGPDPSPDHAPSHNTDG